VKSYCLLFSRINICFLLALFKFFFFSPLCSPLSPLFSISLLCSLLILWWRDGTVGNGLGFVDLSLGLPISAWACRSWPGFVDLGLVVCLCRSRLGLAMLDDLGLGHSWLFCMTFDFDFG
jgi:hypothetical protein